ncbi:MAG: phosphate ABC transporter permease subunit PstC [Acidimicrobiales bacterium]
MSATLDLDRPGSERSIPQPLVLQPDRGKSDRIFRGGVRAAGYSVLLLLFVIGLFLFRSGYPAFQKAGWHFFTRSGYDTLGAHPIFGVWASLVGTVEVAGVAMIVGTPIAIATALFLSEYAPLWSRRFLISMVDLAAAIPSIIFGLWAVFELQPNVVGFSTWLSRHASFIPFFKVVSPPLNASIFIAGLVVGIMIVPIVASISREVFSLAPVGEREAALALGASRWQMIRTVVLPFGRGGMIGAVMLGLGRALEETIAVSIILGGSYEASVHILQHGGSTISQLIATNFGSGGTLGLHDLLMCGFVLFVLTMVINLIASRIVNRSRSGAGVDL